jgi:hypothetical protein
VLPEHVVIEVFAGVELEHLPHLFLDRHAAQEVRDPFVHGTYGVEIPGGPVRGLGVAGFKILGLNAHAAPSKKMG